MMYAYVIYNLEHHRFHYGVCSDLEQTEHAHNEGKIEETRDITPWTLVYHEKCADNQQAVRRVRFFRSQAGYYFLKRILHF
jgi:putative endonuclease